jgi:hypothetical protein
MDNQEKFASPLRDLGDYAASYISSELKTDLEKVLATELSPCPNVRRGVYSFPPFSHKAVPWYEPGVGWTIGYYNLAGLPAETLKQVNPEAEIKSGKATRWHSPLTTHDTTEPDLVLAADINEDMTLASDTGSTAVHARRQSQRTHEHEITPFDPPYRHRRGGRQRGPSRRLGALAQNHSDEAAFGLQSGCGDFRLLVTVGARVHRSSSRQHAPHGDALPPRESERAHAGESISRSDRTQPTPIHQSPATQRRPPQAPGTDFLVRKLRGKH